MYIPNREPFVMIDNLISVEGNLFTSDFLVCSDNLFLEDDLLREFALIENIAQTGAAGLAFAIREKKQRPKDGFMGSIAKLELFGLPKVNEKLLTTVELLFQFDTMFLLKGTNFVGDKKLLECELKLVGI